jgi:prepilin-type N-terminal cleavage/methylation domain-containing protein
MTIRTASGFTLWELLIALVVAGVVLGIGVPNFTQFQRNNAMAAATNELVTGLLAARSEAIKRQVPVTLCLSPNPLASAPVCDEAALDGGFVVFVDWSGSVDANGTPLLAAATDGNGHLDAGEQILLQRPAPGGSIAFAADSHVLSYGANGWRRQSAAVDSASVFLLCDDRANRDVGGRSAARVVRIDPTGRAHTLHGVDDVATAAAELGAGALCS